MNRKSLSAIVGALMAVAGSLGYAAAPVVQQVQTEHVDTVARERIQSNTDRINRMEARTTKALESIAADLRKLNK